MKETRVADHGQHTPECQRASRANSAGPGWSRRITLGYLAVPMSMRRRRSLAALLAVGLSPALAEEPRPAWRAPAPAGSSGDTAPAMTVGVLAGSSAWTGSDGGVGTAARFVSPFGVATDGRQLYVTDADDYTVRRISLATRRVTTLAGKGGVRGTEDGARDRARFYWPRGIAVHGGNLYVTDSGSDTVRKVVIATGAVSTVAGSALHPGKADGVGAAASFNVPTGIATDGVHAYVADTENDSIRKIELASGAVTTVAFSAPLDHPRHVALHGSDLYVTDANVLRVLSLETGAVREIALPDRSYDLRALAVDKGDLLVAHNDAVWRIDPGGGDAVRLARLTREPGWYHPLPAGIATDGTRVYLADLDHHVVRVLQRESP
jgi:hypothetical protein